MSKAIKSYIIFLSLTVGIIFIGCKKETNIIDPIVDSVPYEDPEETIEVSTADELKSVLTTTQGNITILLTDGVYQIPDFYGYEIKMSHITIKSKSGNRDAVIIKGNGMDGSTQFAFQIYGYDYFALKNVTIRDLYSSAIQLHGYQNTGGDYLYVSNCRFIDIREQMIKGCSSSDSRENQTPRPDYGVVEKTLFEYTDYTPYYMSCGIDIHVANEWTVRDCTFKNIIRVDNGITEGAIHFRYYSENLTIERNKIINCARGILFALDNEQVSNGTIKNNFIHVNCDVGIYLCHSQNIKVYNNTIYIANSYGNAIEYRFSESNGYQATDNNYIYNNLTNKAITARNGGLADVTDNVTNAQSSWFVDAINGDLHLNSSNSDVVDKGRDLSDVVLDIDKENRTGKLDIGADEL